MSPPTDNFYAGWRAHWGLTGILRDGNDAPTELLLQAIWRHQRLRRDQLKAADGRSVRVLHPGFTSVEGGPDFHGAVIQMGDEAPRSGDVEIDLRAANWRAHGHDRNVNFKNVILHVVWEDVGVHAFAPAKPGSACPMHRRTIPQRGIELQPPPLILSLCHSLDAPLDELGPWLENESPQALPENLRGKCCPPLCELSETQRTELLREAARVRFQAKAAQFHACARHAGWEQALWEGLFRALGYKHNVWPMQNLAELRPRWTRGADTVFALQARLLGLSGLLPVEPTRSQRSADSYLRRLWDCWWRERGEFSDCILPRSVWRFHGLRPANHPQRRLALAAHWTADGNLVPRLERWCAAGLPDSTLPGSLHEIFQVRCDEFWSWHWTFRSARLKKAQPLLGGARATDLAVNVVLPWLWTRAAEGKNEKLQRVIEHRYAAWPPAEDNAVLKLARQRLLGVGRSRALPGAAVQQGLIQITRDFCDHSNAVCENCRLPELVRGWSAQTL